MGRSLQYNEEHELAEKLFEISKTVNFSKNIS